MKLPLRSFRYRNYRLFFAGQSISLTGTWTQTIAVSWLVYRLTNSPFLLGAVAFLGQIPTFIITPFGGVLADQYNRRRMLVITQSLAMLQAFALAALTLSETIHVWHIFALSALLGTINAFDIPIRQSFVVEMVEDKSDLGNAIALNSLVFNGARLIGPSIAGLIIAVIGEGICFLVNGISFFAVIIALLMMKLKHTAPRARRDPLLRSFKEGVVYAFNFGQMRYVLLLTILTSVMGMSYVVMMPIFARDILSGGAHTLGFLMGSAGLGALIGAVYLAYRKGVEGLLERVVPLSVVTFGLALIAFSFSRNFWLSLVLILFAGFGVMVQTVSSNTVLQNLTHDDKRGRVMSLYAMAFMGTMPFGALIAGMLAGKIGAPHALMLSGAACVLGSVILRASNSVSNRTLSQD
jgi:MFS family permease